MFVALLTLVFVAGPVLPPASELSAALREGTKKQGKDGQTHDVTEDQVAFENPLVPTADDDEGADKLTK